MPGSRRWTRVLSGLSIVVLAALPGPAPAQSFPTKPIRIVVPFAPGGAADIWGRILADRLSTALKQSVVVENKGGAGGMLAAALVAHAEPDGYTLLIGGLGPQILAPATAGGLGFDPIGDFAPVAYIGGPPITWVVPPASDLHSVADLIAAAKAGKFAGYASAGVGTLGQLVVEYVAKRNGLKLTHIPYNTAAFADIIAGRVPMGSFTWGAALGQVQGGTLRALAVTTAARRPEAPDVPTFKELGYDLVASTWFSLTAPKGTPEAIVHRLNQEIIRIMQLPDIQKKLEHDAFDPRPMTPAQLSAYMTEEKARWTPIAQAAGTKK
jgi:tripartite-type tricarboxylate transporter receptor subunit TctC